MTFFQRPVFLMACWLGACATLVIAPATARPAEIANPSTQPTTSPATLPTTLPTTRTVRVNVVSPDVHADRTVTFRIRAPEAQHVEVWGDWAKPTGGPLVRGENDVWSATFGPLAPGIYGYNFKVDGTYTIDRANPAAKPSRLIATSILDLPADPPAWWDRRPGVPHGVVRLHDYESAALHRTRRLRVYTSPGYDADTTTRFPVFYLLHGSGDNEAVWTDFGRANVILDNLIAAGKAKPMVVVMTDGHALGSGAPDTRNANVDAFERDLLGDVIPLIESTYRTQPGRDARAIAGLSMGGQQAVVIGLRDTTRFGWIGGMSSALREPMQTLGKFLTAPESVGPPPRLLWLGIGTDDFLLKENRAFDAMLTERKVAHLYTETPGGHAWPVWRSYLIDLVPRLFVETP